MKSKRRRLVGRENNAFFTHRASFFLSYSLSLPVKNISVLMKRKILFLTLLVSCACLSAQEVLLNADFVSSYIWRGTKLGNASVQPTLGFNWKGWTLSAWGSTEFSKENNEIDVTLEYEYKNLTLYAVNYFTQTEDEPFRYFHYHPRTTGHTFEVGAAYQLCEQFPLTVSWYTTFAGNDYRENEKRAWSSYGEVSYPFTVKKVNLSAEVGFTPWEGLYSDRFNVVNISLTTTKELKLSSKFSLPLFGKLIANPYEEQLYFVLGISL